VRGGSKQIAGKRERSYFQLIKIYIARHGETTWNVEGRIQGRSDPGLSPKGYDQSLALLDQLKDRPISAIYTSTLQRSILTAQPIAQYLSLQIQRQPELDEIAFGILEGEKPSEIEGELRVEWERFNGNRLIYHIPGAENYTDVAIRVKPFVEKILRNHEGKEILLVGHRVVNLMLMGLLLDLPLDETLQIEQTNGCVYLVQRNGQIRIFHYMDGRVKEGFRYISQKVVL
jgi:broad specificity phosphatase PhoE